MRTGEIARLFLALPLTIIATPVAQESHQAQPQYPVPGFSETYVDYQGKDAPFPGDTKAPIKPIANGPPGPDDILFQNLLSAEWIVYSFYQTAVEMFEPEDFVKAGYKNSTWSSIAEIRDNEAGHLRIFQDSISPTSLKPGACNYSYSFTTPAEFLALQSFIEIASEAFLTGLAAGAQLPSSRAALVAIGEVEARHNTWSLIEVWDASPFTGPSDTVFPYPNQILDTTNAFVVNCPSENPKYPSPSQNLPRMSFDSSSSDGRPGDNITVIFSNGDPHFVEGKEYYAVFFHGVFNVTMPFDIKTNATEIPRFDNSGVIIGVIADTPGAPTEESVVASPLYLLEQPGSITKLV